MRFALTLASAAAYEFTPVPGEICASIPGIGAAGACRATVDAWLLLDNSRSFYDTHDNVSAWAGGFVDSFAYDASDPPRIGIIQFNWCDKIECTDTESATVVMNLTSDRDALLAAIAARPRTQRKTCISCALRVAWSQTALQGREDAQPTFILLSDYYQTAGGTNDKAADEADVVKAGGGRILAVGLSEGGLDEVQAALVDEVASAPAEVYTSPLDAAADLLAALPSQVGAICTEVFLACVLSSHCAQPAVLAVHGQAFVA